MSASHSSQRLHVILERLRKSLGLNKSTGMCEYSSRCLIQEQYPSVCKYISLELRRPSVWMFYHCRSPTATYNSTVLRLPVSLWLHIDVLFCHTVQFTVGFCHEAWFMTPEELATQSTRRIYCSRHNAACLRFSGSSSLHFSSAEYYKLRWSVRYSTLCGTSFCAVVLPTCNILRSEPDFRMYT